MRLLRQLFIYSIVIALSACSTKPVEIVTFPDGAEVSNGRQTCISPCVLEIDDEVKYLSAKLPDGRYKRVKVDEAIAGRDNITGNASKHVGETMSITGAVLAVLGAVSALLFLEVTGDEQEKEHNKDLLLFSAAAWVGSYSLLKAGNNTKNLNKIKGKIEIDFADYVEEK